MSLVGDQTTVTVFNAPASSSVVILFFKICYLDGLTLFLLCLLLINLCLVVIAVNYKVSAIFLVSLQTPAPLKYRPSQFFSKCQLYSISILELLARLQVLNLLPEQNSCSTVFSVPGWGSCIVLFFFSHFLSCSVRHYSHFEDVAFPLFLYCGYQLSFVLISFLYMFEPKRFARFSVYYYSCSVISALVLLFD